jgi:WD40 repeat protein
MSSLSPADEAIAILDRVIANQQHTQVDRDRLRDVLAGGKQLVQSGKYNINLEQGQDIQIGDRLYLDMETQEVKDLIRDLLRENRPLPGMKELPKQIWKYLHTFKGHNREVSALAISPDGQVLVSGSADCTIRIWNLKNMQLLHQLNSGNTPITALAIEPDGNVFVSGSQGGTLKFWQLSTGELLHTIPAIPHNAIQALAIHPDGQQLVTGGTDGIVRLWNLQSHVLLKAFEPGKTPVSAIAFSADGKYLVSGSQGGTLRIWQLSDGEMLPVLAGVHQDAIVGLAMPTTGQELISSSSDGIIKQWNLLTGELLSTFDRANTSIHSIAMSQNAPILVTGSGNGTVRFWDCHSRELVYLLKEAHHSPIDALAIAADGRDCITGSQVGNIKVWRKSD